MNLIITVTAEDIEMGKRCDARLCPIAIALRRAVQGTEFDDPECILSVSAAEIRIYKNALALPPIGVWIMPAAGSFFVRTFDRGGLVQPLILAPERITRR